jgi:hypothetical protein
MKLRQVIASDVTASAVAHLALLALVLLFSEVHPFGSLTAEPIAVDIVTPQEVAEEKAGPAATPLSDFSAIEKPAVSGVPAAAQPAAPRRRSRRRPQRSRGLACRRQRPVPSAAATPTPAYTLPEPDLSIKYHVVLGLPPDMSPSLAPAPRSGDKPEDNFDAPATKAADIGSSLVAEFRRHLRMCSKLPASLAASDDIRVKLRVFMTQDGKLATDPVLIEASASMKGPLLMQSAISALQACQPYAMLPTDRYGEWKVLDLFTQGFRFLRWFASEGALASGRDSASLWNAVGLVTNGIAIIYRLNARTHYGKMTIPTDAF